VSCHSPGRVGPNAGSRTWGEFSEAISLRAVAAGTTTAFTSRTEYDALNRPVKQYQPHDPSDARYNDPNVYTQTSYDAVSRVKSTSLPPSEGQTVRNTTTYTYLDNGWVKSSTDPWDIATTYDYNDLGQQTARTLTSAGGSSNRTMSWSYYPDGKLKTRSDDGVPPGGGVPGAGHRRAVRHASRAVPPCRVPGDRSAPARTERGALSRAAGCGRRSQCAPRPGPSLPAAASLALGAPRLRAPPTEIVSS
jgi:hypothetical protein